jgi:type IV conjugative transfer system protein TraL
MSYVKKIPQYLNSPLQFAWWEADIVMVAVFALYFGLFLKGPFYLMIIMIPYYYSKAKKEYPRGFVRHLFYFIGLTGFKGYPAFFEKRFVE